MWKRLLYRQYNAEQHTGCQYIVTIAQLSLVAWIKVLSAISIVGVTAEQYMQPIILNSMDKL